MNMPLINDRILSPVEEHQRDPAAIKYIVETINVSVIDKSVMYGP